MELVLTGAACRERTHHWTGLTAITAIFFLSLAAMNAQAAPRTGRPMIIHRLPLLVERVLTVYRSSSKRLSRTLGRLSTTTSTSEATVSARSSEAAAGANCLGLASFEAVVAFDGTDLLDRAHPSELVLERTPRALEGAPSRDFVFAQRFPPLSTGTVYLAKKYRFARPAGNSCLFLDSRRFQAARGLFLEVTWK